MRVTFSFNDKQSPETSSLNSRVMAALFNTSGFTAPAESQGAGPAPPPLNIRFVSQGADTAPPPLNIRFVNYVCTVKMIYQLFACMK
jgi:hypothetical protein